MRLLHNIGPRLMSNYNTLAEILFLEEDISFDGVYRNVWENRFALDEWRKRTGKRIYLFPQLYNMGGDNGEEFRAGVVPRLERVCSEQEILELTDLLGARLGFHSVNHKNLTLLTDDEVRAEISPPWFILRNYFCYPYGNVDARVAKLVEDAGYLEAWTVHQGDGSKFQRLRRYLNW